MQRIVLLLVLLLSVGVGPGWAVEVPISTPTADGEAASTVWIGPGQPSAEPPTSRMVRANPQDRALPEALPGATVETAVATPRFAAPAPARQTAGRHVPSPALHLTLCVFLC